MSALDPGLVRAVPPVPSRSRRFALVVPLVATVAAATLSGALAPRWGVVLASTGIPAGMVAALGVRRGRTWPGTLAVGGLGAGWCLASASSSVDVVATSVVAVALFLAFQLATGPADLTAWSPTSLALLALAGLAGPVVLLLGRGVGELPALLYVPALGLGVAAVIAPVLVASRRAPSPEVEPDPTPPA